MHGYFLCNLERYALTGERLQVVTRQVCGGSVFARLLANTLSRFEQRMLALGASCDDLADAQRMLGNPSMTFRTPTCVSAWGRRRA
jgi:hypothetical protein